MGDLALSSNIIVEFTNKATATVINRHFNQKDESIRIGRIENETV